MNLLAVDTVGAVLSVAVARDDKIQYIETEAGMRHSELVMDYIDSQMKKASLIPSDLDAVLCMGGPGSFTGLRIGFSIAKGLALSLSIPFYPIPTLDCIALPYLQCSDPALPVIEARKNAFFFTLFRNGQRVIPDTDASTSELIEVIRSNLKEGEKIIIPGTAATILHALPEELKPRVEIVHESRGFAKELIAIARNKGILHNDGTVYLYSGPDYIRETDAEMNLRP